MERVRGVLAAMACAALSVGWSAPASPAGRGWADSAGKSAGWSLVPADSISGQSFILNAVAVPAPGDVWATGYHFEDVGGALEFRALAEHFNGKRFVVVPTPDRETAPAADFLQGVSGTSTSDVWAVGSSTPAGVPDQTLVEHWNGSSWSIVASPDPGALGDILEAVVAVSPTDAWAVGARQDTATFYQHPMALHWNGTAWMNIAVPNPTGCTGHSFLTAVSAAGATNVWATGWCGSGGSTPQQGYVEHWNGARWAVAAAGGKIPAYSQLAGISVTSAGTVWTVGLSQPPRSSQVSALSVRFDGRTWKPVPIRLSSGARLSAVLASQATGIWAAGAGASPQPPFAGPLTLHYAAGTWHQVAVPVSFGSLSGLATDCAGRLWAVGTRQNSQGTKVPLILTRPAPTCAAPVPGLAEVRARLPAGA